METEETNKERIKEKQPKVDINNIEVDFNLSLEIEDKIIDRVKDKVVIFKVNLIL